MEEVKCPYCGFEQEIDHQDGYGFEEDETYSQECCYCGMTFAYKTIINFDYEVKKCDCLNRGEHKWVLQTTYPKCFSKMQCSECGEERNLTDEELKKYDIGTRKEYFNNLIWKNK